tara:strand:+ start:342 stop:965 length:624 start_codon:yes stop_codon:yes gene_type:complete
MYKFYKKLIINNKTKKIYIKNGNNNFYYIKYKKKFITLNNYKKIHGGSPTKPIDIPKKNNNNKSKIDSKLDKMSKLVDKTLTISTPLSEFKSIKFWKKFKYNKSTFKYDDKNQLNSDYLVKLISNKYKMNDIIIIDDIDLEPLESFKLTDKSYIIIDDNILYKPFIKESEQDLRIHRLRIQNSMKENYDLSNGNNFIKKLFEKSQAN